MMQRLFLLMALSFLGAMLYAQQQITTPSPTAIAALPGDTLSFDVDYNTSNSAMTTGLTHRVHFSSAQLTFSNLTNIHTGGLLPNLPVVEDDNSDLDGDPATDRYVLMAWVDVGGNWPGLLPAQLFTAEFTVNPGFIGGAQVNLTADTANGYSFSTLPVQIDLPTSGFSISPVAGLTTTEAGGSANISVALASPPTSDVTLPLSSSDASEGTVSPLSLTFTQLNWDQAQVVTVTGVDDLDPDGDVAYTVVTGAATSSDSNYNGLDPADVGVTNQDDEIGPNLLLDIADNLAGSPGFNVATPITATNVSPGIISFELTLDYNPTLLEYAGLATSGTLTESWQVLVNTNTPGTLRIGGISAVELSGDDVLLAVNFTINPQATDGDCTALTLSNLSFNDGAVPVTGDNGLFCAATCIKGDLNGNGEVTVHDASLALQKAIGIPTPHDPISAYCADADCDGNVLALDAALIQRFALDIDTELCPSGRTSEIGGNPVTVTIPDLSLVTGQSFEIPIHISPVTESQNILSYQFTLVYDPDFIQFTDLQTGNTLSNQWLVLMNDTPGRITIGGIHHQPLEGGGVLVRLNGVSNQNAGQGDLIWDQFIFSAGSPQSGPLNATVHVEQNMAPHAAVMHVLCESDAPSRPVTPMVWDENPNDSHTFQLLSTPKNGQISLQGQTFTYTPQPDFVGYDGFSFAAIDAGGLSITGLATVLVQPPAFFNLLASWPHPDLSSLVEMVNNPTLLLGKRAHDPERLQPVFSEESVAEANPDEDEYLELIQRAHELSEIGDTTQAADLYQRLEDSNNSWYSWAGTSALVALYRKTNQVEKALEVTARVGERRPWLNGLMRVWDGDTAVLVGAPHLALSFYTHALDIHDHMVVDGMRVEALAMKQTARTWLALGEPDEAASWERMLLKRFGNEMNREAALGRILVLEAMADGDLPLTDPYELIHNGRCGTHKPCIVFSRGPHLSNLPISLDGMNAFRFMLSRDDLVLLEPSEEARNKKIAMRATACSVSAASDGFQVPMPSDHAGYEFMDNISQGYHPGLDINGPGAGNADCDSVFRSVARGCVRDASPSNWGSAVVEHYYIPDPWRSQYGHAKTIDYSAGAAITKGASLGTMGSVGTGTCHLHHEIREVDHPDSDNADYYSNLTWTKVGDRYQNPTPFVEAHRSYRWVKWIDEGAFNITGTWTRVTGTGDRDDLKWAYTTSTSSKTRFADYSFTPSGSGTHEVWVFIPYNYATSTSAEYSLTRSDGSVVIHNTINQNSHSDAWIHLGSSYLSASYTYTLEIATNTGESGRKVAIDDFLIIRP